MVLKLAAPSEEGLSHWGTFFHHLSHLRQRLFKEPQLPTGSCPYSSLLALLRWFLWWFLWWFTPALCSVAALHRGSKAAVRWLHLKRRHTPQNLWPANSAGQSDFFSQSEKRKINQGFRLTWNISGVCRLVESHQNPSQDRFAMQ